MPAQILIVDDNHAARIAIRELLGWHGLQVCGDAKDGKEAVEKVVELKPDIVLMDINMPGMNGISAASEIRRIRPATKIVFLTVHDGPGIRGRNAALGAWIRAQIRRGHRTHSHAASGSRETRRKSPQNRAAPRPIRIRRSRRQAIRVLGQPSSTPNPELNPPKFRSYCTRRK